MKIRLLILTLILVLLPYGSVWAEEDHGEDAHSDSMSTEMAAGSEEAGDTESADGAESEEEPAMGPVDEDKEGAPDANAEEDPADSVDASPNYMIIAGGAASLLAVIIGIYAHLRHSKRRKMQGRGYRPKH